MIRSKNLLIILFLLSYNLKAISQTGNPVSIFSVFDNNEKIKGKPQNLSTPYNTAGDKLYLAGNQDGSFPYIGWHVKGEMGEYGIIQ